MIITLTLNPAVDQTMFVESLLPGEVNRVHQTQLDPAGKGINASRVAHRLGWPTIAFGALAGDTGRIVERALEEEGVQHHFVRLAGQTRINITVTERSKSRSTSLYSPGPSMGSDTLDRLDELVRFWLPAGRVLVLAGSLPPGLSADTYSRFISHAQRQNVTTILDASGSALRLGIEAKPDVIKPNVAEAEELLGRRLSRTEEIIDGAREIAARGVRIVIVSMGADGAVCFDGGKVFRVTVPKVERKSTVGSGDSFVAGVAIALARGDGLIEGLRLGTAAGAATARSTGTSLARADDVSVLLPEVRVEQLA